MNKAVKEAVKKSSIHFGNEGMFVGLASFAVFELVSITMFTPALSSIVVLFHVFLWQVYTMSPSRTMPCNTAAQQTTSPRWNPKLRKWSRRWRVTTSPLATRKVWITLSCSDYFCGTSINDFICTTNRYGHHFTRHLYPLLHSYRFKQN